MDGFYFDFDVFETAKGADAHKETGGDAEGRREGSGAEPSGGLDPAPTKGDLEGLDAGEDSNTTLGSKEKVAPPQLDEAALAQDYESSCWQSAGGDSSVTGAESCKSCFTWRSCASNAQSEQDFGLPPRLPRSDTCSSLASSWCSDSEPTTPTTAGTAQDRWTPAPVSDFFQPAPGERFGPRQSKIAWGDSADLAAASLAKKSLHSDDDSLLSQLAGKIIQTLMPSELVGLMSGKDFWHNHGVPRVGIPAIRFTDGPFGARGPLWSGPCSVVTPCGMALGSSWNVDLVRRVGTLLGEECKTKGANVLLGPTVTLARVPVSGRFYELLGEDPLAVSRLGVAYIQGVQAVDGIGACVKHLAVNDQEKNRFFVSAEVDHNVLRSLHLLPFEAAVREGNVMAVMTAYNRINGTFCSEHQWLIDDLLRKSWGFKGMVVSDWGGTHSTELSLRAGLDMEMPKTDNMFYGERLQKLLAEGKIAVADVRARASQVLKIMAKLGMLRGDAFGMFNLVGPTSSSDPSGPGEPSSPIRRRSFSVATPTAGAAESGRPKPSPNTREQQELLQQAAAEGIVLLKNEGVLPLARHQKIAVIGPNAASVTVMGGGSATVLTNRSERSLAAQLRARGCQQLTYEPGCRTGHYLPTLAPPLLRSKDGRGVLKGEFYDESARRGGTLGGIRTPLVRTVIHYTEMGNWSGIFFNDPPGKVEPDQAWSAVFEGILTPEVDGAHELGMFASGSCKVYLDGELLLQAPKPGMPPLPYIPLSILAPEVRKVVQLEAGRKYELRIEWMSAKEGTSFPAQCHLGGCPVVDEDKWMDRAEEAARNSDAAIVCVGTDHWQECEGRDQASMELPGRASELVQRVTKANNQTVVVLNVGSPKELDPWLDDAAALVAAWFGGQEAVAGLADVLLGDGDGPGGRLPITWPRRMEESPTGKPPNVRYPGEAAKVKYDEGLLLGYRWYDANEVEPAFVFGHGLTYTFFEYIDLCLPDGCAYGVGQSISAVVTVENVGDDPGMEVIQLYVTRLPLGARPVRKELGAFAKVRLEPGDAVDVQLEVPAKLLEAPETPAEFELQVGPSSADVCFTKRISVG